MNKTIRLLAAMVAAIAVPALAQTPAPSTGRPAVTAPASPAARPAPSAPAPAPSAAAPATTPAARTTTPAVPAPAATPPANAPGNTPAAAPASRAASPAPAAPGSRIDINSASEVQIDELPGVGPARGKAIVAGRPWTDLKDLVSKGALPQAVLDRDKDRIALANINTSSAADMANTLPGIGEVRARAIVNGRPYAAPQDLVTKKVLTQGAFDKMKDFVAY